WPGLFFPTSNKPPNSPAAMSSTQYMHSRHLSHFAKSVPFLEPSAPQKKSVNRPAISHHRKILLRLQTALHPVRLLFSKLRENRSCIAPKQPPALWGFQAVQALHTYPGFSHPVRAQTRKFFSRAQDRETR